MDYICVNFILDVVFTVLTEGFCPDVAISVL